MKYLYYLGAAIVVILGVGFAVQFGMQGRPVPKIKLSQFKSSEEAVQSMLLRLNQEIASAAVLAIGVDPNNPQHAEIINKFIGNNKDPRTSYPSILVEVGLPFSSAIQEAMPIDFKLQHNSLIDSLQLVNTGNQRVLLIVPHIYASQLLKQSPISRLQAESKVKITSITFVPLAFDPLELDPAYFPCIPKDEDTTGLSALGCAVQKSATSWVRKKVGEAQVAGKLEQYGLSDYLFFIRFKN